MAMFLYRPHEGPPSALPLFTLLIFKQAELYEDSVLANRERCRLFLALLTTLIFRSVAGGPVVVHGSFVVPRDDRIQLE